MRRKGVSALIAALMTMCCIATASEAQQHPLADRPELVTEHREGIASALADGMFIDPRVEALMARAPVGSCLNDPTLRKCPPARAVVHNDGNEYAPLVEPTADPRSVTIMQGYNQCAVNMDPEYPYKSGGRVYVYGKNYCSTAATSHELYVELQKYDLNQAAWRQISTDDAGPSAGGITIAAIAGSDCNSTPVRAWRGRATGYGLVAGVWFAGQEGWFSRNHSCNYP